MSQPESAVDVRAELERLRKRVAELEARHPTPALPDDPRKLETVLNSISEDALRASEERSRSILENMSEGLMLFDAEGNLVYQNPASLRIHGFRVLEEGCIDHERLPVTWKAWDETGREISFSEWPVSRVFRRERFQNQVLRVVRCDTGQEFYGSYNGCPIYDAEGRLDVGFITIRDITDEVRARKALLRSERRLSTFFDSDMMGAVYWTIDGRITDANDKFLRMVGYTREDLVTGRITWSHMTPPEYAPRDEFALDELRRTGVDTPYEKEYIRKDGTRFPILIGAAMLDETRHEGVAFVLDITERKQAEATLASAKTLAEEANRQKDHFLAMLGHELRNPLAPIRNAAALLKRIGPDDEALQRVPDVIERQVTHMTRLIEDLLDMSRISQGKIVLRKEPFNLTEVVQSAIEDHRPLFDANGVSLSFQAPATSLYAFGDSARVSQVVSNLVVNANKFTNRGGRVVVEVAAVGDHEARIVVRDTGIGMDAETQRSIFKAFAQADRSIARSGGGLGLGLALVKGFVELHDGTVSAHSVGLGRGSEFVVSLPILVRAPSQQAESPANGVTVRGRRVLVVEDNLDSAEMLKALLELFGHAVELAHTGTEGLEAARAQKPEVVLCDIGLPDDMDGYSVGRKIRADPALRSAYLVAMTGYGQQEDKERARQAGFDCHLTKPVDPEALQRLLADLD